ncbi:MAG: hypothetical protein J6X11_09725 [Treponema sp.]|nr:hypothetical protein [Treponema sp.]
MRIKQRQNNAVIQALCTRGLQGKSQKLFVDSSLPEVETDDILQQIVELKKELDNFAKDITQIEQNYKEGIYE